VIPALAVLALAAVGLRLWQIDRESLWLDEAGRVAIASLPFGEIAHGVAVVELSPPLYHYVLAVWIRLIGDGDAAVRVLSAVLVVPAVVLACSLGRAIGGSFVGLAAAAMVAANPVAVHYGQEAGMYALLLPLGLGTIHAAAGVLSAPLVRGGEKGGNPAAVARRARSRWILAYAVLGTLALYTHYYAGFLLVTVVLVGIGYSLSRRALHGALIWLAAHLAIAINFLPWLPSLVGQAGLAASVEDWRGAAPGDALLSWSVALLADGASGWAGPLALAVAVGGSALGAWRLRERGPIVWLLVGLVVVPLVLATLASGFFHSFRERGFIVVASALWVLIASALVGGYASRDRERPSPVDLAGGVLLGAGVVLVTVLGLGSHYGERKEDWRAAASIVAAEAGPGDPIFFVHFAAQAPFDRYFQALRSTPPPEVGLPASFDWADGYHARYRVSPSDVSLRVPPALGGARQAWAVLSHDGGRGSEHLVAALDRWGVRVGEHALVGVRVLRYQRAG
jgi:uncharacterized membrane protein